MNKENIYMITKETYEATVNERILLYGFIRQMAVLIKKFHGIRSFPAACAAVVFPGQAGCGWF